MRMTAILAATILLCAAAAQAQPADPVTFTKDVAPILQRSLPELPPAGLARADARC